MQVPMMNRKRSMRLKYLFLVTLLTLTTACGEGPTRSRNNVSNSASATTEYKLRDIGPGGGVVFYVADVPFVCGANLEEMCSYLEVAFADGVAPSTWKFPGVQAPFGCSGTALMSPADRETGLEIGSGNWNTSKILARNCSFASDAPKIARQYATVSSRPGDWFLPSRKELDTLCNEFFKGRPGTANLVDSCQGISNRAGSPLINGVAWSPTYYWSSSEFSSGEVWQQNFSDGSQRGFERDKTLYLFVLPIHAF